MTRTQCLSSKRLTQPARACFSGRNLGEQPTDRMPYNIFAQCEIGRIVTRRIQPQRAVRQAREYRRRGYTEISILDLDTGQVYDARALAATLPPPTPPPQ